MKEAGLAVQVVKKVREGSPHIVDLIRANKINLVINTLTRGKAPERDGFQIRRAAVEYGVPCLTSLDTTRAILDVLADNREKNDYKLTPLQEYLK
jgi:carbamoyl-phosphate synthase large subunit